MSTNSSITAKQSDGKVKTIYCHWDGYISNNGKILSDHYRDQKKIDDLIELGDLSILESSTDKPDEHTFANPVRGYCVAYGRDRGEDDTQARTYDSLEQAMREEDQNYNYYWDGNQWYVNDTLLSEVL